MQLASIMVELTIFCVAESARAVSGSAVHMAANDSNIARGNSQQYVD